MKKRFVFFSLLVSAFYLVNPFFVHGQQTIKPSDPYEHFRQAKFFFDSNNFTAAQEEFRFYLKLLQSERELLISERTTVEYYIAMCSIYSMRPEAEIQAVKFIADHPESPYTAKLITEIGVFYYETGDWVRAIKYLSNSSQTNLEHKYYLAVSYYKTSQYDQALSLFNLLKLESEEEFSLPAAYYAGVMHFHSAKYEDAIEDFKIATSDPKYSADAQVWISSAYVKLNRYNDLINYVEPILRDSTNRLPAGNLAAIIADLQFQKHDFSNAAKSYAVLSEKSPNLMSRESMYRYAFSLYKSQRFEDALILLAKPTKLLDSLDQEIAKTRALILIDQQKWDLAYTALKEVAYMPFNKDLADEAYVMYLNLLQSNQQWPVLLKEIKSYQKRIPQNKLGDILVSLAINALQKQGTLSDIEDFMLNFPVGKVKFQELYQSTCYHLASDAYEKHDDKKAITYFKKSLDFSVNREMAWYARYGLAEIFAKSNKNSDAIKIYLPLLAETSLTAGSKELSQRIRLSLAYSFAFITLYDRSLQYFEEYIANKLNGQRNADDLSNLAEISIANGNLQAGIKYFDEAIQQNTPQTSSLISRKAVILYNLRMFKEAANVYQEFINKFPNDSKVDLMFYRLNEALARLQKTEDYAQVIKNTTQFIQQKSVTNPYYAPVLLIRAQAYDNTNQWYLAMDDYVSIVRKFTADSSAKEAIIGATDLLKKAGRHTEVLELRRLYANQNGEDASLPDQWFEICSEMFRLGKFKLVVPELVRFLQEYPAYAQLDELNYMLGVSTFYTKDYVNAVNYLKQSQKGPNFSNKAQFFIASIFEEQKRTDLAISQLVDLKANISFQDTLMVSVQDKLKLLYGKERKFENLTQLFADIDGSDSLRKSKWAMDIGQFAQDAKNYELADKWFGQAILLNQDEIGALAALGLAKSKAIQKEYKKSNEFLVSEFVQQGSSYYHLPDAIVGLAYLQMADNFIHLKNLPQAKAILQSLLASSTDNAVKVLAKKKIEEIQ
jgi:tetratricopeptide (TPR) repeat protein